VSKTATHRRQEEGKGLGKLKVVVELAMATTTELLARIVGTGKGAVVYSD
jgi:hypothetical protein